MDIVIAGILSAMGIAVAACAVLTVMAAFDTSQYDEFEEGDQ
jgi:hypothetical protein